MAEATSPPEGISALAGLSLPSASGVAHLVEATIAARLVLRAPVEVAARMLAASGLENPTGINRAIRTAAGSSLQLGPDEWLVLAASGPAGELAAAMAAAAGAASHALLDVSERSVAMTLEGPRVEDVLAAGCPLPLEIQAFAVGRATRTLWAKAEIVLWRQEPRRFHIEVARSFAPYLVGSLAQAIANEAAFVAQQRA